MVIAYMNSLSLIFFGENYRNLITIINTVVFVFIFQGTKINIRVETPDIVYHLRRAKVSIAGR